MGTTFINLQVRAKKIKLDNILLSDEYISVETSEEWMSIYEKDSEYNWKKMFKLGKKAFKGF